MGIYNNASIGVRKKSVGENTYKTVRGRTIVSKRIMENSSKTQPQTEQRKAFSIMGKSGKLLSKWIDRTFDKTKYGSQRNNYVKLNAPVMAWLKSNNKLGGSNYLNQIATAIEAGIPMFAGFGSNLCESEFTQAGKELSVNLVFSKNIAIGDKIIIVVAQSYSKHVPNADGLNLLTTFNSAPVFEYIATEADAGVNTISLDKGKVPALATACSPMNTYNQIAIIASAAIISGKESCQCYFSSLSLYVEPGEDDRPVIE